jgi:hypothetical protein
LLNVLREELDHYEPPPIPKQEDNQVANEKRNEAVAERVASLAAEKPKIGPRRLLDGSAVGVRER